MDCKDSIKIKGLEVYAGHGVFAKENKEGQMFLIDAVLFTDIRKAGLSDFFDRGGVGTACYGNFTCLSSYF